MTNVFQTIYSVFLKTGKYELLQPAKIRLRHLTMVFFYD